MPILKKTQKQRLVLLSFILNSRFLLNIINVSNYVVKLQKTYK